MSDYRPFPGQVPPPETEPDQSMSLFGFNPAWSKYLLGAAGALLDPAMYAGSDADKQLAVQQANNLIRQLASSIGFRTTSAGVLQWSGDGGATWTDLYDPRQYVLIKSPSSTYRNTAQPSSNVPALELSSDRPNVLVISGTGAIGTEYRIAPGTTDGHSAAAIALNALTGTDQALITLLSNGSFDAALMNYRGAILNRSLAGLPTASVDWHGAVILIPSGSGTIPYICLRNPTTGAYFWSDLRGANGTNGADGTIITDAIATGLAYTASAYANLIDHPTVTGTKRLSIGIPAGAPGTDGIDGTQIADATATGLAAGATPTVALVDLVSSPGFKRLEFGIPAGATGASGTFDIDDVAPTTGTTKTYRMWIDSRGTYIPFICQPGDVIRITNGKGFWANSNSSAQLFITGYQGDATDTINMHPTGSVKAHCYAAPGADISFTEDTIYPVGSDAVVFDYSYVVFQANAYAIGVNYAQLWIEFTVTRGSDPSIIGVFDFTTGEHGWHAVSQAEVSGYGSPINTNWGGQYLGTGGGGYHPTYNSPAGMYALSITHTAYNYYHVDDLQVYWEDNNGSGFVWYIEMLGTDNVWRYSSVYSDTAASGSRTIHLNADFKQVIIHTNAYGTSSTNWRLRKAILTGTKH